jgi:Zn-dependent peptidase ImmA (M78 family)
MPAPVPFISQEEIQDRVDEFLREYHHDLSIPVPIEEIIEFGLSIEIRPMRGLKARFQFEGAITHDLNTILVDEGIMQRYPNRYRFTLAHELAHRLLHGTFISECVVTSNDTWQQSIQEIDPKSFSFMEHQAYIMAGRLLVPTSALKSLLQDAKITAARAGIDLDSLGDEAQSYVAGNLAKVLQVSTEVVDRRLRAEQLFRANTQCQTQTALN